MLSVFKLVQAVVKHITVFLMRQTQVLLLMLTGTSV